MSEWVLAAAGAKRVILCVVLCAAQNTGNVLIEVTLSPRVKGAHCHAVCLLTLGRSAALSQRPSARCNLYRTFTLRALSYLTSLPRAPHLSLPLLPSILL